MKQYPDEERITALLSGEEFPMNKGEEYLIIAYKMALDGYIGATVCRNLEHEIPTMTLYEYQLMTYGYFLGEAEREEDDLNLKTNKTH